MSKKLHLVYIGSGTGQKFDRSFGVLKLEKASDFWVTIKEYAEERKMIDGQITAKKAVNQRELDKAVEIYRRKEVDGWTPQEIESQNANNRVREATQKKSDAEVAALEKKRDGVEAAYKDVKWAWQVVGSGVNPATIQHNESFSLGMRDDYNAIPFPKLLEGGGLAWLEVFRDGDPATGKIPEGFYVQATGTPKVIRTEWTDHECNPISGPVAFGSEVLLNVYTEGMYGHEIKIELIDDDLFDPDDTLSFGPGSHFTAEVDIHRLRPAERGKPSVGGSLNKSDATPDGKPESEAFVQKSAIKLVVNPAWKSSAGTNLKIYPTVTSMKTGEPFEGFKRTYLEVSENAKQYDDPSAEYPITPTFIGEVATNVAAFHPCKYDEIKFAPVPESDKAKARTVFTKEKAQAPAIHIPIICADVDHMTDYSVTLVALDTKECRHAGANNHTGKSLPEVRVPQNFKVVSNDGKELKFKAGFLYDPPGEGVVAKTSYGILKYIWPVSLPAENKKPFIFNAATCRYDKPVEVLAYPDVKWTLEFRFGMKGPEQYTHTGLPGERRHDPTTGKPDNRFNKAQQKAVKAGRISTFGYAKRADGMELEFHLGLKAEYNKGEELELAEKYAQKIKAFLDKLVWVKDKLDKLTKIDDVNAGHKKAVKGLNKFLKLPITGSLDYPAISVAGKWQAAVDDATNEVYTDGKVALRFNPLLKGDVSLDIIASISYVPAWGQAVRAIELALNAAGAELNFMLTIFGQVNVEAEYAFADKGGSNVNVNGELGLKLVLSGKVKVNLNAVIFSVNGEVQAEAYAVTSVKPKVSLGHDKAGTFVEAKMDFMGINLVCTVTAISGKKTYQYKDTFNILEREDDFIKGRWYFIS